MRFSIHHRRSVAIGLFLVLLCSSAVLAADENAEAGHAADSHASSPGLTDPVLPTIAWTAGIFLVVLVLLHKLAWGPLLKALDEREEKIRESLQAADLMRAEQVRFQAEQEQVLAAARKEANEIVAEGKRDAEAVKEKIVSDAKSAAEDSKNRAVAEIDRAKDNAVIEIHQRAVELSVIIAEKLVGHAVTVDDQERLVQQTIDQYKDKN